MNKSLFLLIFALFFATGSTLAQTPLKWHTNLEEAQKLAKKQKKPLLLYFTGSDWCAPCKKLKEDFFNTERFIALAQNAVLVEIDIPRRIDIVTPEQLAYNKEVVKDRNKDRSFPKLIAYTSRGKKIDEVSGYGSLRDPVHYFNLVEKALK